jgi:phage protein D
MDQRERGGQVSDENWMDIKLGTISVKGAWAAHLSSVTLTDAIGKSDHIEVTFELPSGSGDKLLKDLDLYGKEWSVKLMKGTSPVREFGGDIMQLRWTRSGGAPRSVTITGVDPMHRLRRGRKSVVKGDRRFVGKKASEIVSTIVKERGFTAKGVQATNAAIESLDWDKDDLALIKKLAKDNGYITGVEVEGGSPDMVFARREQYSTTTITLDFGVDILDINASHALDGMVSSVKVVSRDQAEDKKTVEGSATASDIVADNAANYTGPKLLDRNVGPCPHVETPAGSTFATKSEADDLAKGIMKEKAAGFVSGSATCYFNPDITCGCKIQVTGAGWPFDGKFVVEEVSHSLDASGYRTRVSFSASSIAAPT